jgi:hypothetical protein
MGQRYRGRFQEAFAFPRGARTLDGVPSPRRSWAFLGLGALVGMVSGWVAGLLRSPKRPS